LRKELHVLAAACCLIYATAPLVHAQAPLPNVQLRTGQTLRLEAVPRIDLPSEIERCVQQGGEDCDGDGAKSTAYGGFDCDDTDPHRYPGAAELPNKIDDDCDGLIDNLDGEWWSLSGTRRSSASARPRPDEPFVRRAASVAER